MALATIDFSLFLHGTEDQKLHVAATLVESFRRCGFVRLVNHGISLETIEKVEKWNEAFFRLDTSQKSMVVNIPSRNPQRGWSYKGAESTARLKHGANTNLTDEKEHFDIGAPDDVNFPNKWMEDVLPGFQQFSETFYHTCQELCLQIMAACEQGCGLAEGTMVERCKPAASELRYNYYPPVTLGRLYEGCTRRGWPHTDFGLITLLFQDNQGGLQYEDREHPGHFLPLQREMAGEIAVNISDTFQRWTNASIPAGVHQVWLPAELSLNELREETHVLPERRSTVFFFKAHQDKMVGPLLDFVTEDQPARYDNITALEFHKRMTEMLVQNAKQVPT